MWALDIIEEAGFTYDSSIFPIRHDRYGDKDAPRFPYRITAKNGGGLIEFPLSTWNCFGVRVPVAGGGYFRLFPYVITRMGLSSINRKEAKPFVFYLHPWELDVEQPRVSASYLSRFRHYVNLSRVEERLRRLLNDFRFTALRRVLANMGFGD